jgi:hypothetical protein
MDKGRWCPNETERPHERLPESLSGVRSDDEVTKRSPVAFLLSRLSMEQSQRS